MSGASVAGVTDATAAGLMPATAAGPILAVESANVVLGHGWRRAKVLSDVDLVLWPGEIVGLVGETGSGKTTLARAIVGLAGLASGRVLVDGQQVSGLRGRALRAQRRRGLVQLVFQDPLRSLDPDLKVADIVAEGLRIRGGLDAGAIARRVRQTLSEVGLDASVLDRTPGQISGGQRQRVSIARALATQPRLLICDEPVSALDASTRNHVLRLLDELRDSLGLTILIISHDLSSLAGIADRVAVMYRGQIVEYGPADQVFTAPLHPYTALLMASAPSVRHDQPYSARQLRQNGPHLVPAADGCVFADRCAFAAAACAARPPLEQVADGHDVACHRHEEWPRLARDGAGPDHARPDRPPARSR
ncbi:MAG TPA: ABC transporter ATP-binding protein [Streptosporangiaceae bacterium]|jgi:oligopeptide/dipeptide ABC transporter ATP-binding protein|nr:ABC transporter ATP-binding protein [Streptosporangiaceae bacterium]